jgi:hypothetical protein
VGAGNPALPGANYAGFGNSRFGENNSRFMRNEFPVRRKQFPVMPATGICLQPIVIAMAFLLDSAVFGPKIAKFPD